MLARDLQDALDAIPDTGEIVIVLPSPPEVDEMLAAWRHAHAEATAALERWCTSRTREAFAAFRAAEDRADAAQDALAARRTI
jgi:hypothetical protein